MVVLASYITVVAWALSFAAGPCLVRLYSRGHSDRVCCSVLGAIAFCILIATASAWVWIPPSGPAHVIFVVAFFCVGVVIALAGMIAGAWFWYIKNGFKILERK